MPRRFTLRLFFGCSKNSQRTRILRSFGVRSPVINCFIHQSEDRSVELGTLETPRGVELRFPLNAEYPVKGFFLVLAIQPGQR
jgi:hypothetical protein